MSNLEAMALKELRQVAVSEGVDPNAIEQARDGDEPKPEMIQLIQEKRAAVAAAAAAAAAAEEARRAAAATAAAEEARRAAAAKSQNSAGTAVIQATGAKTPVGSFDKGPLLYQLKSEGKKPKLGCCNDCDKFPVFTVYEVRCHTAHYALLLALPTSKFRRTVINN